jgi:hypothetical protein
MDSKGTSASSSAHAKGMNQNGPRSSAAVIFGPVLHGPVQNKWKVKGTCTGPALSRTLIEIHMDMDNLFLFMYTIIDALTLSKKLISSRKKVEKNCSYRWLSEDGNFIDSKQG